MATTPVIEDVAATSSWRRRAARAWATAVTAVGAPVAALGAWAWQHPLLLESPTWILTTMATVGAGLALQGGQLTRRDRRARTTWREALPTPHGPRPGWALGRPPLLSRHNAATTLGIATVVALPSMAAVAATGGALAVVGSGVVVALLPVMLTRELARRVQFPAGVAITRDGVVTAEGLTAWDTIREVEPGNRWWRHVRLTVAGRRRKRTLYGNECALPAEELARIVEHYRADPRRVTAAEPPVDQVGGYAGQDPPQTSPSSGTVPETR